jgi:MFS family permease
MNFCVAGPVAIGLAYLTKTKFGSPAVYGIVISAVAGGSLLGALLAGVWKIRRRGVMILLVSAVLGVCLGAIGLIGSVGSIASVLVIMGAAAGLVNVHIGAWAMQRIDTAARCQSRCARSSSEVAHHRRSRRLAKAEPGKSPSWSLVASVVHDSSPRGGRAFDPRKYPPTHRLSFDMHPMAVTALP